MDMTTDANEKRAQKSPTTRLSVSFPCEIYQDLEGIARQKKVSVAWVIRDAAEKYVADQWPLLAQRQAKA